MSSTANQINSQPGYVGSSVTETDLVRLPDIPVGQVITSKGLVHGIGIVLAYTEAWLRGIGCIPLHNAMEDAATAEISRAQIWEWRNQGVATQDDGQLITAERIAESSLCCLAFSPVALHTGCRAVAPLFLCGLFGGEEKPSGPPIVLDIAASHVKDLVRFAVS